MDDADRLIELLPMRVARVSRSALALATLLLLGACRSAGTEAPETTSSTELGPTTTVTSATTERPLVASPAADTLLLLEPAQIPEGFDECERRATPGQLHIKYCGPSATEWLVVRQDSSSGGTIGSSPVEGIPSAVWVSEVEPYVVAAPLTSSVWLVVEASGVTDSQTVEIVQSVLMIGARERLATPYRLPIDLTVITEDQAATWFGRPADEVFVDVDDSKSALIGSGFGAAGGLQLATSDSLFMNVFDGYLWIENPRLIDDLPYPTVGGASAGSAYEGSQIIWSAGGVFWNLQGGVALEELVEVARRIQAAFP